MIHYSRLIGGCKMRPTHLERISNSYNKKHASDFSRKTAEKKYLEPWGLSLMEVPPTEFSNTNVPLSKDDELSLFRSLHFVKYRLKKAYRAKQRERYYKIYLAMRNRGIACNWPLVPACIKLHLRRTPPGIDMANLFEQGYFALMSAGDGFDPWLGWKLSTYACTAIRRSFFRHKKEIHVEPIDMIFGVSSPSKDEQEEWAVEQLTKILNSDFLTEKEKAIISMRFYDNLTLDKVGRKLGMSKERARQIQHATIAKLKEQLQLQIDRF